MPTPSPLQPGTRLHAALRRAERSPALDRVGDRLAVATRPVTTPAKAKSLLTGAWFGHALHPVLTDFAEGAWMAGSFLDLFGPKGSAPAARRLVGFGLLTAVPTALTGLAEWSDTRGTERRAGVVHAGGSTVAFVLYACSYLARRRDCQATAAALGTLGGLVAIADGYVAGHLTLARGVGVGQTAFAALPPEWKPALLVDAVDDGHVARARAGTADVLIARHGERFFAAANRCTYRGGRLDGGTVEEGAVICPRHGCRFRLADGAVARGPASIPLPVLDARVVDGRVEVRAPGGEDD